jgi:hypothetical protein
MITTTVNEEGTLKVDITFTDEEDTTHELNTLTSVNWQLSDMSGNVINERSFANGLITSSPVMLTGDDLAIGSDGIYRTFALKIVYDSTNGTDLNSKEEIKFEITDLISV